MPDFNDVHVAHGLDAVRQQIEAAMAAGVDYAKAQTALPDARQRSSAPGEALQDEGVSVDAGAGAIGRFYFIYPAGDVWDSVEQARIKRGALKNLLGAVPFRQWDEAAERRQIAEAEVKQLLAIKAQAAHQRATADKPDWQRRLRVSEQGVVLASIDNTALVLAEDVAWQGVLAYCRFSARLVKRKAPPYENGVAGEWTDADTYRLRIWLGQNYAFTPKDADALGAVTVVAENNGFHPVQDYLRGLAWDGKKRLGSWLQVYLGAGEDREDYKKCLAGECGHTTAKACEPVIKAGDDLKKYLRLVGGFFMVSAVARVMRPPVKVDSVLILGGLQGLGKSTTAAILAGEWFTDTPVRLGDKDGLQQLQGNWIVEMAELDSFNKAESTTAKMFFSSEVDKYRPSYGRVVQTFPRQCVFIGTTNQAAYLKDSTGNRRYWPVTVTQVDADALRRDRDQLWAEAVHCFEQGARWWPDGDELHLFEREQDARFEQDVWEEIIYEWLRNNTAAQVTTSEVLRGALELDAGQMKPPEQKRVGHIMAHLGWEKSRPRIGGERVWVYVRPAGWS